MFLGGTRGQAIALVNPWVASTRTEAGFCARRKWRTIGTNEMQSNKLANVQEPWEDIALETKAAVRPEHVRPSLVF